MLDARLNELSESGTPQTARPRPLAFALTRVDLVVGILLLGVMLLGGALRFQSTNWDDQVHFHPDERFLTAFVAANLGRGYLTFTDGGEAEQAELCNARYPESGGVGPYFDARCSDLNPHNVGNGHYAYGTLPAFTAHWTASLLNQLNDTDVYKFHSEITLVWRSLSAFYDTVTVLLVFLIGLTLHSKWVGLVAAALYACAVLPIQIAHFATADAMTVMWVALTLLFAARAQAAGGWLNYAVAGVAFGAALASRFNVFPLVVVIIGASALRMLPLLDARLPWAERRQIVLREFGGLVLAGFTTLLIFRVFNPYAFTGPGFFGLLPNFRWLDDLMSARNETSINNDGPPHWQWVGRPTYLFAWTNMVLWGMGLAFGLTGWLAFIWSGWRALRGRVGAARNLLLFAWILIYFGWVGANFVMSMRYYLVLYPAFAVLAAWALVEIVRRAFAARGARISFSRVARRALAVGALAGVVGLTALGAVMFSNIYRNMSTFTQASHWVWENAPGDFAMTLEGLDGAPLPNTPLVNIALGNRPAPQNSPFDAATRIARDIPATYTFTAPADGIVSRVHAPHIGVESPSQAEPITLRVTLSRAADGGVLATGEITDIFPYDPDTVGDAYDIPLSAPVALAAGENYAFTAEVVRGATVLTGGSLFTWEGGWDEVVPPDVCALPAGITLADNPPPGLSSPSECERRAPLQGLIYANQFDIYRNDDVVKRDDMIQRLDTSDYLIIGTNRRYDSHSRIPLRWPLTNHYYEALFAGELGYEIVATFEETFEWGPFKVSDQYLPTYKAAGIPAWLNEFEAEEAFHVYDHPVVYIFQRSPDYDGARVREILYSVPLDAPPMVSLYNDPLLAGQWYWDVKSADAAPTALLFSPDMRATQTEGGTWAERFDRDSALNSNQLLAVVVWWLAMSLFGWMIWPWLFVALPGLADRGYGFAKFFGIFVVSWLAWFIAGTARWPVWSPEGVRLIVLALAVLSVLIAWANRARLRQYIRENARLLLTVEALWAVMYLLFVVVRMTNPDLWTTGFGGEKPMNVAYLNGVLRSTIFPPVDPWYAGGFINYYYYGYVIVGTPMLFTGIMPSLAYNLILPSLFAATGLAAFSGAYNIVSALGRRVSNGDAGDDARTHGSQSGAQTWGLLSGRSGVARLGNPYLAGAAALLLAAVFGNLDTPRVLLLGFEKSGEQATYGFEQPDPTLSEFLMREYEATNGAPPEGDALTAILARAENASVGERARYELGFKLEQLRMVAAGMGRLISEGVQPPINADRWFWGPSRVVGEGNNDQSITEMPYFTFIYGDLHAHMIAMPLMLAAVALVFNELILAGRERRGLAARALAVGLVGLSIGMMQGVNTWDWPTFTLFGVLGLGYAWWLGQRRITRRALWAMLAYVGGFVTVNFFVKMPYALWFASNYTSLRAWDGRKTALWMYLDIYGLFLFVIVSLLLWETARWLRGARVRSLRGRLPWLVGGLAVGAVVLFAAVVASAMDYQVALIVLPLVAWIALLFFRPGQSVPMQFVLVLIGLALCITLGVEVVVLDGDSGRQNMIFKFYIQVWLLLSVACGAGFAWLLQSSDAWRGWLRNLWFAPLGVLIFAAALFPIMATVGKSVYRLADDVPPTLDGAEFMRYAENYSLESESQGYYPVDMAADADAIAWLQDNVQGTPAIIEGITQRVLYEWGGRIAIHTGLPTVVGWDHHQRQQRTLDPLGSFVNQRIANVNYFYTTDDLDAAWRILTHYDVQYVVVAGLERARYIGSNGFAKFDEMVARGWLEIVHERPFASPEVFPPGTPTHSRIYRVVEGANPGAFLVADPFSLAVGQ